MQEKLILVVNDDGWQSQGIKALAELMTEYGSVVVVAPSSQRSGFGMALSVEQPISFQKEKEENGITFYSCTGTPVDCVKFANASLLDRQPDFIVSGINHGSNISCNTLYSGTMGAAIEGCINGIPSVGFSHMSHSLDLDFTNPIKYFREIMTQVIKHGLPEDTCLNVNYPDLPDASIKGVRVTKQARGYWEEVYTTNDQQQYALGGTYHCHEPKTAQDHDFWAVQAGYVAITPIRILLHDLDNFQQLSNTFNK